MNHPAARPTPLQGLGSMATAALMRALVADYEQRGGVPVVFRSIGGVEAARRIQAGEPFDLVVLASDAIAKLLEGGHLIPDSGLPIVRSSVAAAVPEGAPPTDIGSEAALRAAVLAASGIGYSTGPSGNGLLALLQRWGIEEAVRDRLVQAKPGVPVGQLIARREVTLGFQQLSELAGVPGIRVLGTLPEPCSLVTTFSGAIPKAAAQPDAARALLAHLASAETDALKRQHGLTPAHAG